jgi:alanine-glyoxylate transaminase/serine-glyoxylate transaminase/serine-pyruvate transaminase
VSASIGVGFGPMSVAELQIPPRLLLGSGPSPVPRAVLDALAAPTIGHLDPAFGEIMEETAARLRRVFVTGNRATLPVSGTGSAGMEAMVVNCVWPGERVVVGVAGAFGERMADELLRQGAVVVRVEAPEWGRAVPVSALIDACVPGVAAVFVVHGETSTGVLQPLDGLAEACASAGALLMIDCVTSLAGAPLEVDAAGVDVAFSGTQKCLNCPPGLAPLTLSERAVSRLLARDSPVRSWYFDLRAILSYWRDDADGAPPRVYHHTAPINMVYGLCEALRLVLDEGLPERWDRHARAHNALLAALREYGLERIAPEGEALVSLLAVAVPEGIDEAAARRALLLDHGIEISGGLGPLAGRAWRIGVMGEGARLEPQSALVRALGVVMDAPAAARARALDALTESWHTP